MSLKWTFLASKKSCTSCPYWGEGGVILTKSKRKHFFSGIRPLDARNYDGIVLFRDMKSFMR